MIRKKLIPIALISCMVTSFVPLSANATSRNTSFDLLSLAGATATDSDMKNTTIGVESIDIPATGEIVVTSVTDQEPTGEALEKIITAVKAKISVPNDLSEFEYYYNTENYNNSATWDLSWRNTDGSKRISIQSDQNGNILSFYSYANKDGYYTPKYLQAELKASAGAFIKKVSPDIYGKVEYVGAESQGTYSGQYVFQYQRVENGIPMKDNTITVGINYETGKVVSYGANWLYNVKVPSADVTITKAQAAEKIGKKIAMKLSYQNAYSTDKDGNTIIKAFLVYSPDQNYIAVDAKTGEVYTTQNQWVTAMNTSKEASAQDSGATGLNGLTKDEIKEVDEIGNLISKSDAIKAVTGNKNLLIDTNLKSITAKLYKQQNYDSSKKVTNYVWNIYLSDPRTVDYEKNDTYRTNATATVDAKTGKLISFNSSVKDYYNMTEKEWESVKVKYTAKQSQAILEGFLKEQIPDLYKNSILTDNKESYVIAYKNDKEVYGGYYYQYERVNEGINYAYNGIYGAVDGVTGKIYSYSYNWNQDLTFESPKNIISSKEAFDYYIAYDGFALVYEINSIHTLDSASNTKASSDYSLKNEIRLVYKTDISPAYISPFTGKQLNYDGKVYTGKENLYAYSDTKSHSSDRNIKLLADLGIGFSGGKFLPNQEITSKELSELLSLSGYYYDSSKYELKNDSSTITRVAASKFVIQILGYEKIAKLEGIYNVDYKDKAKITTANLGYVALADSLKLITSEKNEFKPTEKLSRADAADMIIGMFSAK